MADDDSEKPADDPAGADRRPGEGVIPYEALELLPLRAAAFVAYRCAERLREDHSRRMSARGGMQGIANAKQMNDLLASMRHVACAREIDPSAVASLTALGESFPLRHHAKDRGLAEVVQSAAFAASSALKSDAGAVLRHVSDTIGRYLAYKFPGEQLAELEGSAEPHLECPAELREIADDIRKLESLSLGVAGEFGQPVPPNKFS
ncbi:MAG TPA: hypothetical protein VMV10_15940 [Pirellulales bacterium]|nr:hypothetical protein [Pirellulales bacterium]